MIEEKGNGLDHEGLDQNKQSDKPPRTGSYFRALKPRYPRRVGIHRPGYGYSKVSYGLQPEGFTFERLRCVPVNRVVRSTVAVNAPIILPHSCDLLHTWNSIPVCRTPFIVSFENELPRFLGDASRTSRIAGFRQLRSDRCRRILALSDAARGQFQLACAEYGFEDIDEKVEVFRGGVSTVPAAASVPFPMTDELNVLMVAGQNCVSKGAIPAIRALGRLREDGARVRLIIVGRGQSSTYLLRQFGESHLAELEELLRVNSDWVTRIDAVPNAVLRSWMPHFSCLLHPTFDESLGWVIIEAIVHGLPAVASSIFAIPELIIDGRTGILLPIEVREHDRRWAGIGLVGDALQSKIESLHSDLENAIFGAISESDFSVLRASLPKFARKLSREVSISAAAEKIREFYTEAAVPLPRSRIMS